MLHVLLFCVLRCEGLADIIWQLRQQVRQLENLRTKLIPDPQNKDFNLQELLASVTELLSNLVTGYVKLERILNVPMVNNNIAIMFISYSNGFNISIFRTFVIEKQPPQVMKTNTRFTATVRLLVGAMSHMINLQYKLFVSIFLGSIFMFSIGWWSTKCAYGSASRFCIYR